MATQQRGFTLVEILVVMALIALLTIAVSINLGFGGAEPEEQLQIEIERLSEFANLAEDQAIITGEPIGLAIVPPQDEPGWRYQWRRYRAGQWVETQAPLVAHTLPETVELTLNVEGEELALAELYRDWEQQRRQKLVNASETEASQLPQEMPPTIVFYPGGEVTSFLLTLYERDSLDLRQELGTSLRGRVEIVPQEEEAWQ